MRATGRHSEQIGTHAVVSIVDIVVVVQVAVIVDITCIVIIVARRAEPKKKQTQNATGVFLAFA